MIKDFLYFLRHPKALLYRNTCNNERFVRFLRKNGAIIGENTRFISPQHCTIDPGRMDYISIGDNCCLSYVTILAHDYSWYTFIDAYKDIVPDSGQRVSIGNNCFIGYQACILRGTTIGDNVIIGARSVVKGVIPSNTVWAGVPARQISSLEDFYKKRLEMRLEDAKYRRDHIVNSKHRKPTIEEMGWFSFLFLERTEDNYSKYIKNLEFNNVKDTEIVKRIFFETQPTVSSFEAFLRL